MGKQKQQYWVVIPAAGSGSRMGSDIPKQYLPLNGKPVLAHTVERFLSHPDIAGVVVALSANDNYWSSLNLAHSKLTTVEGGQERCYSVMNALNSLGQRVANNDWVLVHDAARPCLRDEDIDHLILELQNHPVGGILGVPVTDTVKRTNADNEIVDTVDRSHLWRAMTPQMFRLGMLKDAMEIAINNQQQITDEASAIELLGLSPKMVEGHADNIKITHPQDLALAELYLKEISS
jgi:2-C-methyl-D-erythritol 4-phosphate cytidylyltransferase